MRATETGIFQGWVMPSKPKTANCPICKAQIANPIGKHIRESHGDEALHKAILGAKADGMPDPEIGARFGISFNKLEAIITEAYGANISVLKKKKKIKYLEPPDFKQETTTVWSFKRRGDWATHDGRYRGNWSPYIPRNVIVKYSKPGDIVLDYFVGAGTTAVEAKLLGRRCIARDINPGAIGLTRENLDFELSEDDLFLPDPEYFEPEVSVGDARNLADIEDESIDLICAHPPYAGIIKYSANIPGDLSDCSVDSFLDEMAKVAEESLRVLKPGSKCAILIGDTRRKKHVVPIGFKTIKVFLDAGFELHELIIKRQHNCKTTGFWYTNSIKYNFLLLAHEYLPIFQKPKGKRTLIQPKPTGQPLGNSGILKKAPTISEKKLESSTVWIFPEGTLEKDFNANLFSRYSKPKRNMITVSFDGENRNNLTLTKNKPALIFIRQPLDLQVSKHANGYLAALKGIAEQAREELIENGILAIETQDVRCRGKVFAMGNAVLNVLKEYGDLLIKEIIVVLPENGLREPENRKKLDIIHKYLLIYLKKGGTK